MKRVLAAFARNTVFANIILVLIFLSGGIATMSMIRENFPEFSLNMITISVPYPGADPEEVEEGISRKIEEAIEGQEGIKQYTTNSSENVGSAVIEVKEDYDVGDVLEKVRSRVDAISSFPVDAEKPVITELTLKDPVMLLYFSGDMSERRIKEWSERIKDEIQQVHEVLDQFAEVDPVSAELVKLRFFAGLTQKQSADILGLSKHAADENWAFARAWMFRAIQENSD